MNHTAEDSLPNELSKVDDAQQHKSGEPNFDAKLRRRAASAAIASGDTSRSADHAPSDHCRSRLVLLLPVP
jgi:hypothetical protein